MVIKRLKRSKSGKVLNPGKKIKRVFLNKSRFNHRCLTSKLFFITKNNEKVTNVKMYDSKSKKKVSILKKYNILVSEDKKKYEILKIVKKGPAIIRQLNDERM